MLKLPFGQQEGVCAGTTIWNCPPPPGQQERCAKTALRPGGRGVCWNYHLAQWTAGLRGFTRIGP
jgi:hypothetical protein